MNPSLLLTEGLAVDAVLVGEPTLVAAMKSKHTRPTSLATGDFDKDGWTDVAAAFRTTEGGAIALYMTDERTVAGSGSTWNHRLPPFRPKVSVVSSPATVDFLAAGDFDADGFLDIAGASKADSVLHLFAGDGTGGLAPSRARGTQGLVTAMTAADVNLRDGLEDLVVGVATEKGSRLLVFEGSTGAINADPESFEFRGRISDIAIGRLDDHWAVDLAVASGKELTIIAGRYKEEFLRPEKRVAVPSAALSRKVFRKEIQSLAVGDFSLSGRSDLAIAFSDGSIAILDVETDAVIPLQTTIRSSGGSMVTVRSSAWSKDDLVIVEPDLRQIRLLSQPQFERAEVEEPFLIPEHEPMSWGADDAAMLQVQGVPVALAGLRLNVDALDDLVVAVAGSPSGAASGLSVSRTFPYATFVVNDSQNKADANLGDGKCETEDGACTFHAAVAEANHTPPGTTPTHDLITFTVSVVSEGAIGSAGATSPVTIDGKSAGMVEVGNPSISVQGFFGQSVVRGMVVKGLQMYASGIVEENYIEMNAGGTAFDDGYGLRVEGEAAHNVIVQKNTVGTLRLGGSEITFEKNFVGTDARGANPSGVILQVSSEAAANITDAARHVTMRGNVVSGITGTGLYVLGKDILVQGNHLGVNALGTETLATTDDNVRIGSTSGPISIGGTTPDMANVISGSGKFGIYAEVDTCIVQGNYIGTDLTGTRAIGNARDGMNFTRSERIVIGGDTPGSANVISGNGTDGVSLFGDGPFTVVGNYVGTDVTGTDSLGNGTNSSTSSGIEVHADVAGALVEDNKVGFNRGYGILAQIDGGIGEIRHNEVFRNTVTGIRVAGTRSRISQNSIYQNGGLGISLSYPSFPLPNDPGDVDGGYNDSQNYPDLSLASDGKVGVAFNSQPGTSFDLEFFGSPECNASGNGEGRSYLETVAVTTDGSGNHYQERSLGVSPSRKFITATATDPDGNTSEFSNCVEVVPTKEDPKNLVLVIMQDTLNGNRRPVQNTWVEIFRADPSDPLVPLGEGVSANTGNEAMFDVDALGLSAGTPFIVRTWVNDFTEHRGGHEDVGDSYGVVHVDNLSVDNEGRLKADVISTTTDTTLTHMGHVFVGYNLTVSIEWPASDQYVADLEQAFRMASNLLFDVTNGQAYFNRIAIYDDKQHWLDCDVRVLARTTAWPSAGLWGIKKRSEGPLQMPAVVYGSEVTYQGSSDRPNRKHNVLSSFVDKSLTVNILRFAQSIVHEFGHYAFRLLDEYQNEKGEAVHYFKNFSIMDDAYGSEPMRSEYSAFETPEFRDTEQFIRTSVTAWDWMFRIASWDLVYNMTGDVRPAWIGPNRLGMTHPQYIAGPNADLSSPDADIGSLLDFSRFTSGSTNPRREVLVVGADGKPLPKQADVFLTHFDGKEVPQGATLTAHDAKLIGLAPGTARILGGLVGEKIVALSLPESGELIEYGSMIIPAGKGSGAEQLILELEEVQLAGSPASTLEVASDGRLFYRLDADEVVGGSPSVSFVNEDGEDVQLALEKDEEGYSLHMDRLPADLSLRLNLIDSEGEPISIPQNLAIVTLDTLSYVAPGIDLIRLYPGPEMTAEEIALLTSPLPFSTVGVADSLRRVSDLISVEALPAGSVIDMSMQIGIDGDSLLAGMADAVTVYQWVDGWMPRPTRANVERQTATVEIAEPGTYCAFLDPAKATVVGVEADGPDRQGVFDGFSNHPNPFAGRTIIPIELARPALVRVEIYNLLGQLVATLVDRRFVEGRHEVTFDAEALPPGLYLGAIIIDGERRTGLLVHL